MAKEKVKTRRSSADKAINALIAIVLVVVIALAAFALYDKFRPRDKVKDAAADFGLSVEEFITEFGLGEDVTPNTSMNDVYDDMTIENALKLEGSNFDEFAASYGLAEVVTPDMKVSEVNAILEQMMTEAAEAETEEGHVHEEGEEGHVHEEAEEASAEGEAAAE